MSPEFANIEDFDDVSDQLEDELFDHIPEPIVPNLDTEQSTLESPNTLVDYSTRGARDVILSGPIIGGKGPGRFMKSRRHAYVWAATKYGSDRVETVREVAGRWAFLIKNLKAA